MCVHMCGPVNMCICVCMCVAKNVCIYMCVWMNTCTCTFVYAHEGICVHVCNTYTCACRLQTILKLTNKATSGQSRSERIHSSWDEKGEQAPRWPIPALFGPTIQSPSLMSCLCSLHVIGAWFPMHVKPPLGRKWVLEGFKASPNGHIPSLPCTP